MIGGSMNNLQHDISRWWHDFGRQLLEAQGRRKSALRFPFPDNEVVSSSYLMMVSPLWNGYFLNLHPSQFAVAIAPDGQLVNVRGGYNELSPGRYILHYIDRQNRVSVLPRTSEATLDGAQVSLELIITYRVADPLRAMEAQQPVDTLFAFIQSDLKEFIRTHKYDEIVGDKAGRAVDHGLVSRYIRDQHLGRENLSKIFRIADIVVEGRTGDPKLTQIQEDFQVQQRQNVAQTELQKQNRELAEKVEAQQAEIKRIRANSQATEQEILQKMESQRIELDNERSQQELQQQRVMRALGAIEHALSNPAYPYDPRGVEIIRDLLSELGSRPGAQRNGAAKREPMPTQATTSPTSDRIDTLTDMLLNWSDRKRT
jgi:hypothetical protein